MWKIALATVVVLAGVAWLWRPDSSSAAKLVATSSEDPAHAARPLTVELPAVVPEAVGERRVAATAPREAARPESEVRERWVLRGVVDGIPPGTTHSTTVSALFIGLANIRDEAGTIVQANGEFELDLTEVK